MNPFGEIKAAQYESILAVLNKIKKESYKYAKHKEWIKTRINDEKSAADYERKRKFMLADW